MTHSVSNLHEAQTVIVGVDTHKHMHVAVAIDSRGIRLGAHSFGADSEGYRALLTWAEAYGGIEAVGLSRTVHRAGHRVVEVNRVDRRLRRAAGKSDTIDAEAAARAVLAGQATATPKTADGAVEMMRQLKVARDSAVKARTTAMSTLKQILVNARHRCCESPCRPSPIARSSPAVRDCDRVHSTHPSHPGNTRSGHWPVAGSPSPTTARRMTYTSPDSPPRRRPPSGRASPLAPTPPPRCSLSSGITLSGFARKPPLPSSAVRVPSPPPPG